MRVSSLSVLPLVVTIVGIGTGTGTGSGGSGMASCSIALALYAEVKSGVDFALVGEETPDAEDGLRLALIKGI